MLKYLIKRFAWLILIVFVAITVTFILSRIIPADPARLAAGLQAGAEQVAELRREMGLDKPVLVQYVDYLKGIIQFDFGRSLQSRGPVLLELQRYLPATIELVVLSFVIYSFLGVLLGVVWAVARPGVFTNLMKLITTSGVAIPVFWAGLLLQIVFASKLGIFPVAGRLPMSVPPPTTITGLYFIDSLLMGDLKLFMIVMSHLTLPVVTLVFSQLAVASRLMRSTVSTELLRDYVRTARAKGQKEYVILIKHVLKNALNPVISMLGLQFGWLMGGTILVEVVFSWPGLGLYLFNSFRTFDYNPIMAVTIVITVAFVVVNTIVDLIYPILDPRVGVD